MTISSSRVTSFSSLVMRNMASSIMSRRSSNFYIALEWTASRMLCTDSPSMLKFEEGKRSLLATKKRLCEQCSTTRIYAAIERLHGDLYSIPDHNLRTL